MSAAILKDISIDEYHSSPRISHSKLSDFAKKGARFFAARYGTSAAPIATQSAVTAIDDDDESESGGEESEALTVGQAFEDLLCRPKEFQRLYAIKPEGMSFARKDGKAWKADALASGRTIITASAYRDFEGMVQAIHENAAAIELIQAAYQQWTFTGNYPGLPGVQSRPDFSHLEGLPLTEFRPYTVDLKTTIELSQIASGRAVLKYGYHSQAALCRETLRQNAIEGTVHYLLAIEKSGAHRAQLIKVPDTWLAHGWGWCRTQMEALARHYETGSWPRVDEEIAELPCPEWLAREAANVELDESDEAAA